MTKVLKLVMMGQTAVYLDAEPVTLVSAKGLALLCYLAVTGRGHTRQALAGLLWGDLPEADARRNLRGVIMKLRQDFEPYLEISHQTISFAVTSSHWVDVIEFNRLCQQGDVDSLEKAVALYQGDFLEDVHVRQAAAFEEWIVQQRERIRRDMVMAVLALGTAYENKRNYEAGMVQARRLVALEPGHEAGHRLLMRLLAKSGQRSAALRQYDTCVEALAEMDVVPTEETAVLLEQIRSNTYAVSSPPQQKSLQQPVIRPSNHPPFIAGPPITHADGFYGRSREIKRIMNLLGYLPMQNAAVIGPRRSGKTSLLHHLKQRPTPENVQWIFVDFQDRRMGSLPTLLPYLLENMHLTVPEPCDLETFMDIVSDELEMPTVVLMDEIEVAMQRYTDLDDAFWESLRSLATNQVGGRLAFVLAGAESPSQLATQSGLGSPFFNIFGYVAMLGPLTEVEARDLIAHSPTPFAEDDVAWILEVSGRWPILLQILCRECLLALEEGQQEPAWREEALMQCAPFMYLKQA
jgi:DNA-binding SARP family transcriptional activator